MISKILATVLSVWFLLTGTPLSNYDYSDKVGSDYEGLREYYEDFFDIGAAVAPWMMGSSRYCDYLLKNYTSLTAENAFKQPVVHPSKDVWDFSGADTIADFCRANGLKLRGHCLVWGEQNNWMLYDDEGNPVSKDVYYERMQEYIETMMHRYGDVVSAWDVVNEPFGYDVSSAFKKSPVYMLCGEEYVTKAFEFARAADPNAVLVLNETSVTRNIVKTKYLYKYLDKWLKAGVPIDAIGLQGHWTLFDPMETPERMEKIIRKLSSMGLDVQITEIDISVYAFETDKELETLPYNMEALQTKKYKDLFRMLRRNADAISSVTFWGVRDSGSYLNKEGKPKNWPLLFDGDLVPKQNFFAVVDF